MPVAGVTAPVTFEGFIVIASAEHVATWIAARALNPEVQLAGSEKSTLRQARYGARGGLEIIAEQTYISDEDPHLDISFPNPPPLIVQGGNHPTDARCERSASPLHLLRRGPSGL